MAPMFQGFPVHVGGVRTFVGRRTGRRRRRLAKHDKAFTVSIDLRVRSFVRCFSISVFNLPSYSSSSSSSAFSSSHNCSSSSSPDLMGRNENVAGDGGAAGRRE